MNRYIILTDNLGIFLGFSMEDRTAFFSYDSVVNTDTVPALSSYEDAKKVANLCGTIPDAYNSDIVVVPVHCVSERATIDEIKAAGFGAHLGTLAYREWRLPHGNC